MADKYLNYTGLNYYHNRIKNEFASASDLSDLADDVADIQALNPQENVIETISVNGTNVPPSNKNIALTIPTDTSSLTNDGDGESPFATEDYVDENGGKIDVIKVNGTAQTITNKEVDLTVPTKVSDLTNDSNFQTNSDVSSAITTALANSGDPYLPESDIQQLIDDELADITGIDFIITDQAFIDGGQSHSTDPDYAEKGKFYLVLEQGSSDVYDEYIWINKGTVASPNYAFEKLGSTTIDLSSYWTMTSGQSNSLIAITTAEIDTIVNA